MNVTETTMGDGVRALGIAIFDPDNGRAPCVEDQLSILIILRLNKVSKALFFGMQPGQVIISNLIQSADAGLQYPLALPVLPFAAEDVDITLTFVFVQLFINGTNGFVISGEEVKAASGMPFLSKAGVQPRRELPHWI